MVTIGKCCEFLFLYCLISLQVLSLLQFFMSGDVLFGVALLMGELCVVWSGWADLLCWVSINCEQ
jgi:hypothetical protein